MNLDDLTAKQLSRRKLIKAAGIGGLAIAAAGAMGSLPAMTAAAPLARPMALSTAAPDDSTPEGFMTEFFAQRARAMTTGDTKALEGFYDPSNRALLAFEQERCRFYAKGLGARWGGSTVLDYASAPELLTLTIDKDKAVAQVYERLEVDWVARLQPEVAADQQRNPARYRITPVGSRGETATGIGVRHELTLTRGQTGWRVAKDAFDEYMIYLASPDVVPGSWVDEQGRARTPAPGTPKAQPSEETPPARQLLSTYNHATAQTAALNNALVYNSNFCSYYWCGVDCANFVSQCFNAGGLQPSGPWYVNWSSCVCPGPSMPSTAYQGSDTWVNNRLLRNWINTSGRGTPVSWWNDPNFQVGDFINYRWNDAPASEDVHHITIVTGWNGAGPLICSHTSDLRNAPFNIRPNNTVFWTFSRVY